MKCLLPYRKAAGEHGRDEQDLGAEKDVVPDIEQQDGKEWEREFIFQNDIPSAVFVFGDVVRRYDICFH